MTDGWTPGNDGRWDAHPGRGSLRRQKVFGKAVRTPPGGLDHPVEDVFRDVRRPPMMKTTRPGCLA